MITDRQTGKSRGYGFVSAAPSARVVSPAPLPHGRRGCLPRLSPPHPPPRPRVRGWQRCPRAGGPPGGRALPLCGAARCCRPSRRGRSAGLPGPGRLRPAGAGEARPGQRQRWGPREERAPPGRPRSRRSFQHLPPPIPRRRLAGFGGARRPRSPRPAGLGSAGPRLPAALSCPCCGEAWDWFHQLLKKARGRGWEGEGRRGV